MSKFIGILLPLLFLIIGIIGGYFWSKISGGDVKNPFLAVSCEDTCKTVRQDLEKKLEKRGFLPPQVSSDAHATANLSLSGIITKKESSSITFLISALNPLEEDEIKVIRISADTRIIFQKMKDLEVWQKEMEGYKENDKLRASSSPGENPDIPLSAPVPFVEETFTFDQIKVGDKALITLDENNKDLAKVVLISSQTLPVSPNPAENTPPF